MNGPTMKSGFKEEQMPIVKRSRRVWTPEMDAELISYYEHGLRPSYMAEQMGLTVASVEGRYRNLKRKGLR